MTKSDIEHLRGLVEACSTVDVVTDITVLASVGIDAESLAGIMKYIDFAMGIEVSVLTVDMTFKSMCDAIATAETQR